MQFLNPRTMEKSVGRNPTDLNGSSKQEESESMQAQTTSYSSGQESILRVQENTILSTLNYGMFRFDPLNRVVRPDKLDRLHDAIRRKNLLHLFPIVVTSNYTVVDGQHRLRVAEAMGVPIYYIVSSQMRIEDAASVSANTDSWNSEDYLAHWCKIGLPDYLSLKKFLDEWPWLSVSHAKQLCFKGNAGGRDRTSTIHRDFTDGTYKANNLEQANRVCVMAMNFKGLVPFWRESPFISALRNLDSNMDYDHARMMAKMQYQSTKLVKCATAGDYIAVINAIYNYGVTESKRVVLTKISSSSSKWRD